MSLDQEQRELQARNEKIAGLIILVLIGLSLLIGC